MADPGQIEQVIMNLVVNARDAMPDGGKIIIETADAVLDAAPAFERPHVKPGGYVALTVSDTGIGMSREIQERVFEPFFTTKELGRGAGLGLSTVYGIVKQHEGYVHLYSEPGKGAMFRIYLPSMENDAAIAGEQAGNLSGGAETILVVDDDAKVRTVIAAMLSSPGYRVLEAKEATEALRIGSDFRQNIDVLLTDVIMPEVNGKELADAFRMQHPETAAVFMSGYTDRAIAHHGVLDPEVVFIQKPIMPYKLAQKLREALDRKNNT